LGDSDQGVIYNANGTAVSPATTYPEFVAWCGWVHCESIVTLPAEVNNSSLAAAIVSYSIQNLHFTPTYWEIGNEPLMWTHFGVPWPSWNSSQDIGTTPVGFAKLVRSYVSAIRTVDPSTPILGIGGVGAGGSQSTWITDDVATNGPNLSGIAIHVYPAGTINGPEPPAIWFASLQGGSALPNRVNSTLSELQGACPTCRLSVLADELGSGTLVPQGDEIAGGYLATYVSAEILQTLPLDLTSADYYNLESDTPGSWFTDTGAPSPAYFAYADLAQRVGAFAAPMGVNSPASGLLAAVGGPSAGALTNLILLNINSSYTFSLDLAKALPNVANASIFVWNGPSASPTNLTWGPGGPTNLTVPPMSLAILSNVGLALALDRGLISQNSRHWLSGSPFHATAVSVSGDRVAPLVQGTVGLALPGVRSLGRRSGFARRWGAGNAPAISRRCGQVAVVSPFPFQATFDSALSSTVRETPHPVSQGLLPGRRPFHHIPTEPPVHHHHRTVGLCRFCSGARTLARRAPTRHRVSRRGDFPQRPAVADSDHRQLPSTSWRKGHLPPGEKRPGRDRQTG